MQGTNPRLAQRCRDLDDDQPDDVCPGCGLDLALLRPDDQWHYTAAGFVEARRRAVRQGNGRTSVQRRGIPAGGGADIALMCEWTLDHLTARAFRRAYLADYEARRGAA